MSLVNIKYRIIWWNQYKSVFTYESIKSLVLIICFPQLLSVVLQGLMYRQIEKKKRDRIILAHLSAELLYICQWIKFVAYAYSEEISSITEQLDILINAHITFLI